MTKKRTPGYWVLNVASILLAVIFIGPIVWAFAVSLRIGGKQILSVFDWFTPPYTLQNYPEIILNSSVPTWLKNSLIIAVVTTALTVIFPRWQPMRWQNFRLREAILFLCISCWD